MKKLLNTLYVTSPNSYLHLDGETIAVFDNNDKVGQVPLHNIGAIVCFGYKGISPALMGACVERNIGIAFMTPHGRYLASVEGVVSGNVLVRHTQMMMAADEEKALPVAKMFIKAKIHNSRWSLERTKRDHSARVDENALLNAIGNLKSYLDMVEITEDIGQLMGVEGTAAKAYFSVFNELILKNEDAFHFDERNRRPPLDRTNAMLSFIYSLLGKEIASALRAVGIDPYIGFLHQNRSGRESLALDMLEELRAPLADRFVLSMINMGRVVAKDFDIRENVEVFLKDNARKEFLGAWQDKKKETITHPFLNEKVEWGMVAHAQALLFSRFIRGDLDSYPPFLWK